LYVIPISPNKSPEAHWISRVPPTLYQSNYQSTFQSAHIRKTVNEKILKKDITYF
jgi:hypothetical protein